MESTGQARVPPEFVRLAAHSLRWQLLTALTETDLRVRELVDLLDRPQNLLSYHLRKLRDGGLVTAARSTHDGRDSYYHLDLDRCADALAQTAAALHPTILSAAQSSPQTAAGGTGAAAGRTPGDQQKSGRPDVLLVCTGNSIRSPIAEALVRHHGDDSVHVTSAGTRPKPHLHPNAVRVLGEQFGIDVVGQHPRGLDTLPGRRFDHVITLCDKAREAVPEFADQPRRTHWSIPEPASVGDSDQASYPAFQQVAAEIDTRVRHLLPTLSSTNRRMGFDP